MKRYLLAAALACLALAGCGGGGSHSHATLTHSPAFSGQSAMGSVHPPGWGLAPSKGLTLAPSNTLTAEMFDTVTLGTVPSNPFALAGYTAGSWPTFLPLRRAYPTAHTVSIAIQPNYRADCLDDEPGDATPPQAGPWVLADIHAGFAKPCVYGDLSEMPAIQASLRSSLGSNWRVHAFLWLAWYRNIPGLVNGYDAVQWTDHAYGRNLDESTVTFAFLSIAHPPYVAPKPRPVPTRTVCFGPKAQLGNATCKRVRPLVASWSRASAATHKALSGVDSGLRANRCVRPYRRGVCVKLGRLGPVLSQRAKWFDSHIAAALKQYS